MKVAIIGAGIAGLSCAIELEKHGIKPVIFEKQSNISEYIIDSSAILRLFSRTSANPLVYLKKKYQLNITPSYMLKEVVMTSQNKNVRIKGNLGSIFLRSNSSSSLENQLAANIQSSILFNNYINYKDIENDFDYIVAATGEDSIAKALDNWVCTFNANVRVAVVLGDFRIYTAKMWMNTRYAKGGFAYLIPYNEKKANLVLVVNNITPNQLEFYWKEFFLYEKLNYRITETRDYETTCGYVNSAKSGNIYLAGNSGGFVDDMLGFGLIGAIESGFLAARSIACNLDYNKLINPIYSQVKALHTLRAAMNTFDNRDFDKIIGIISVPGIKQFIYNNPLMRARYGSFLAQIYNAFKYKQ